MLQASCLHSFVQDYIYAGGICDFGVYATTGPPNYDPLYPTTDQCDVDYYEYEYYSEQYMDYFEYNVTTINTGVCSTDTVTKLATRECQRELASQPNFIYVTLNTMMYDMCRPDEVPGALEGLRKQRPERKAKNETHRLTPIGLVLADLSDGVLSTDLKFGMVHHYIKIKLTSYFQRILRTATRGCVP